MRDILVQEKKYIHLNSSRWLFFIYLTVISTANVDLGYENTDHSVASCN